MFFTRKRLTCTFIVISIDLKSTYPDPEALNFDIRIMISAILGNNKPLEKYDKFFSGLRVLSSIVFLY
ncbi:MAG: hypothetical protein QXT47_06095 [Desulfurococcaceae archaeon]